MNYHHLFQRSTPVKAGLIGAGAFGCSFLAQARYTPNLAVPVVCDRQIDLAQIACRQVWLRLSWRRARPGQKPWLRWKGVKRSFSKTPCY